MDIKRIEEKLKTKALRFCTNLKVSKMVTMNQKSPMHVYLPKIILLLLFSKRIYLFIHENQREREVEAEGEAAPP